MMRPRNKEQLPSLTHSQCRWMWGLHWGQHHSTSFILPVSWSRQADWWISPVSVFADVGPGRPRGGLWAVEIGQDVFQVFFISSLAQDLFDDAGGDGYSTLGSVFILPERQSRCRNKIIFLLSARCRDYDDLPSSQTLQQSWICLCFFFFFSLSLKCKYNPIGQTSLRTQSTASFHQRKKKLNPNTERRTVTRQHPVPLGSTRQPPYSRQKFINKACSAINGTQAFSHGSGDWKRHLNVTPPPKLSIMVTNMRRVGHKGSDWDLSVSPVPQTTALFCPSDVRGHNYV